jgi:hypothetical protein
MNTTLSALFAVGMVVFAILYANYGPPRSVCTRSHTESYTAFVLAGDVLIPVPGTRVVCDEYTPG